MCNGQVIQVQFWGFVWVLDKVSGKVGGGGACVLRRNISDTYLLSDSPVT